MITYRVRLDVPRELVLFVTRLLARRRREIGTRKGTRSLGCYRQALFVLAWYRDKADIPRLGAGFGISQATSYRYVAEGTTVIAAQAPGLADCGYEGAGHGILTPVKKPKGVKELDINARTRNMLLSSARCLGERGFALLSQRWKTLQNVTASPSEIGPIARAALVLTLFEHKRLA